MDYLAFDRIFGFWEEEVESGAFPEKSTVVIPSIFDYVSDTPMPYHDGIVTYLENGFVLSGYRGFNRNIFNRAKPIAGGSSILTDGRWLWLYSVPFYIKHHRLTLSEEFLTDIVNILRGQSQVVINQNNMYDILDEYKQMRIPLIG